MLFAIGVLRAVITKFLSPAEETEATFQQEGKGLGPAEGASRGQRKVA